MKQTKEEYKRKKQDYAKRYYSNSLNMEIVKDKYLQEKFGISIEDYYSKLLEQDECCDICKRHRSEFKINFAVDHCHATGKVRGLLCYDCNVGISFFKENEKYMENAIKYISKHNKNAG